MGPWTAPSVLAPSVAPPGPRRTIALWSAGASVPCWAVALMVSLVWPHTRPPCPPGYVRLIDFAGFAAVAAGGGAVSDALAFLVALNRRLYRTVAVLTCAWTAMALRVAGGAADNVITNRGVQYDSGCWTF